MSFMNKLSYSFFELPNKLRVIIYPVKGVRTIAIYAGLLAGGSLEIATNRGTLHFLEHQLFTVSQSYPTIHHMLLKTQELALSYNAAVGSLDTRFWFFAPDIYLKEVIKFIADVWTRPLFVEENIERSKRIILSELRGKEENPEYQYERKLYTMLFGKDYPYTQEAVGTEESIQSVTQEKIEDAYKSYIQPQNIVIAIAGNADQRETKKYLLEYFSMWKSGKRRLKHPLYPREKIIESFLVHDQPRKQILFDIAFPVKGYKERTVKHILTLNMINHMIGGGILSDLNMIIREQLGYVYSVGSRFVTYPYAGAWFVSGSVESELLHKAVHEIIKILTTIKNNGFSQDRVDRTKKYLDAQTLMYFSDPREIAYRLWGNVIEDEDILLPNDVIALARTITPQEINQMAHDMIDFSEMKMGLMGNESLIEKSGIKLLFYSLRDKL